MVVEKEAEKTEVEEFRFTWGVAVSPLSRIATGVHGWV
jgi:hypothetical protein